MSAADRAKLHARPLRALGAAELGRYAFKALTTWGSEDDLRHFLPRILELVARDELGVDAQIVLGKLAYGEWERWPEAERAAIEALLAAWLESVLSTRSGALAVVLSSILRTGAELGPLLAKIELAAARSPAARARLLELVAELASSRTLDPWTSAESSDAITRWLADPERGDLIERAIAALVHPDERDVARWRLDELRMRADE